MKMDQTDQMVRLVQSLMGAQVILLVLSCSGLTESIDIILSRQRITKMLIRLQKFAADLCLCHSHLA